MLLEALWAQLTGGLTRPSIAAAARGEVRVRLAEALNAMAPTDREVADAERKGREFRIAVGPVRGLVTVTDGLFMTFAFINVR